MRFAAGVEYDGREFHGWQRQSQAGLRTVQGVLEGALGRIAAHPITVGCAGRTDAGVHALGQVIHFDTTAERPARAWLLGTNSFLPADVKLSWVQPVAEDFHARYLAIGRSYRYVVHNASSRSALWRHRAAEWPRPLDVSRMSEAAQVLIGEHDFSSFRGKDCQAKTAVKLLRRLEVNRQGDWVTIDAEASGFLHNMVRNISGSLLAVGCGHRPVDWMAQVLASRQRAAAGETAPACGLYFLRADFPERFALPAPRPVSFPL